MIAKILVPAALLAVLTACSADKKVTASSPEAAPPAAESQIVSTPESVTLPPNAPQLAKLRIER